VPNKKYYVRALTGNMPQPVSIYSAGGDFRFQATYLDRWSAVHNPGEPDFLTVQMVSTQLAVDEYPIELKDPTLKSLTVSAGTLTPAFSSDVTEYELEVPYGTQSVTISAEPKGVGATVTGTGTVPLEDGYAYATITVTSGDGEQMEYSVMISEQGGQSDASLQSLTVSQSALDPVFSRTTYNYNLVVPKGTTSVDVDALPTFGGATVTGAGAVTLIGGAGTASITVKSLDASTTNVYTVNISEATGLNYAMSLPGGNGASSSIDISGLNLKTLPYTIEMWFKPEGVQPFNAGLFYNRSSSTADNAGIQYSSNWQTNHCLRFMSNAGSAEYGTLSAVVMTDVWHHVAVVLTESTRTIYLDGVATSSEVVSPVFDFSAGKLYLGWDNGGATRTFKGLIDEVRVWNAIKTEQELKDNKLAVLEGSEPNLLAYWNFDLPNSSQAVDISSGKKHGLIAGGTYVESFPRADVGLTSLTPGIGVMYPDFNANINKYHVVLPIGTTTFQLSAEASEPSNTVTGTGTVDCSSGSGSTKVVVSTPDGKVSNEYTVNYIVDVALTLRHSYPFSDGTANDVVGSAHGTVVGGTIEGGNYTTANEGEHIALPADVIAINSYPSLTLEAYVTTPAQTDNNRMVAYFGNTTGTFGHDYLFMSHKSMASVSCLNTSSPWSAETGVAGTVLEDGAPHHLVVTMTNGSILWYVDGLLVGEGVLTAANKIYNLSNTFAYLCKSGYTTDLTWLGTINEFNIYAGVMDAITVEARSKTAPTKVNNVASNSVNVFPTVTKGLVTVKSSDAILGVSVMEMTGKVVDSYKNIASGSTITISNAGLYLLKVDTSAGTKMVKVVVVK
jgi:hypothetical protein